MRPIFQNLEINFDISWKHKIGNKNNKQQKYFTSNNHHPSMPWLQACTMAQCDGSAHKPRAGQGLRLAAACLSLWVMETCHKFYILFWYHPIPPFVNNFLNNGFQFSESCVQVYNNKKRIMLPFTQARNLAIKKNNNKN